MVTHHRNRQSPTGRHRRKGTTLVEFAVVFPLFLTVLFAVIEFGHGIMTVQMLNAAARRAARVGITSNATNSDIVAEAELVLQSCIDRQHLTIHVRDASIFENTGDDFGAVDVATLDSVNVEDLRSQQLYVVTTSVDLSDIAIFSPRWLTGNLTLSGRSVARRE